MKFIKNNLKVIVAFVLGVILTGGIVYAATSASQVTYITEKNTDIKNVSDALNDLYEKQVRFDTDNDVIHGGDSTAVTSISGFEIGKTYIIYIRHKNDNIPTMSNVDFVIPMRKVEYINTDAISNRNIYIGIVKAKSQTINLSEETVISAKKLYY